VTGEEVIVLAVQGLTRVSVIIEEAYSAGSTTANVALK